VTGYELIIRNRAQLEIAEIIQWYEEKQEGLGGYFLLCFDASLEAISRYPIAPRVIRHEYRRIFVRRFPVGVYYIVRGNKIFMDVVEPLMRDPKRLEDKLKDG